MSISIEGLIEFIIFGYLNIKTAEFSMNGEILGISFAIFSTLMSGFILPIFSMILLIITKK